MTFDLARLSDVLDEVDAADVVGRLREVVGLSIRADIPGVRLGDLCSIERRGAAPLLAEVVGFRDHSAMLLPLERAAGLGPDDPVRPAARALRVKVGDGLLGRVVDGLGRPRDRLGPIDGETRPIDASPPEALERPRIVRTLPTGLRAIDGLLTLGEGQRIGLFAGAGVGKSSLLGQIARQADAEVFVVCLVGERGREINDFLQDALGEQGREHGVVVCATSDEPPLVRLRCAQVATTIAEGFRDRGKRVLFLMDSITRFARAARDVGLSIGEAPARRGYPASVFAALPALLERAGPSQHGSITAIYSVLVESEELDDPIADELRGLLDGHITLDRSLAARGHFPAVSVGASLSRLMQRLVTPEHALAARKIREHVAHYEDKRELVSLGAYTKGSDRKLDAALSRIEAIEAFLRQQPSEHSDFTATLRGLRELV